MTEDQVSEKAGKILGLADSGTAQAGVGQLTTFNQLGFKGVNDKPDGWYLPYAIHQPAIILEVKASNVPLKQKQIDELLKNCHIAHQRYKKVVGILYNGEEIMVFKNEALVEGETELHNKEHYLGMFAKNSIDKQKIYNLTKRINDCLHIDFGINNLYHRMIFTACALVAKRFGAALTAGMNYQTFHASISSTLKESLAEDTKKNYKLSYLMDVFDKIEMNSRKNQEAINSFIGWVGEISESLDSDYWEGEDVMGIFFNEFNRYKAKSESGQVFTPDHITSLMYRLIDVHKDDIVGDFACGSGAFLVKAMGNMVEEAGGVNTEKARQIKASQLYGIEFHKEIYALACANMLIHKDGKTNLEQLDSRTEEAAEWIRSKHITKVLMNPPFERKYGCLKIVGNVLNSVPMGTQCAFILPDKKLEKDHGEKLLKKHTLEKIIKLPEKTFTEGVTASVFIFTTGKPQNDKPIFACWIQDDGLETVKNQGRQDIRNRWPDIENRWVEIIYKQSGDDSIQWLNAKEHLSYQMPQKPFELSEEDFTKAIMDYELFKNGINVKEFVEKLLHKVLYGGQPTSRKNKLAIQIGYAKLSEAIDISYWHDFSISQLFDIVKGTRLTKKDMHMGIIRYIGASAMNNGITAYISNDTNLHPANTITVNYNGSVGVSFYQDEPFWASDDVNVLYPKFSLNRDIAMFLIPIITKVGKEKYEFIDKWKKEYMEKDTVKLPATSDGQPDFAYMEHTIKTLKRKVGKHIAMLSDVVK